jgi:hypothetical protein
MSKLKDILRIGTAVAGTFAPGAVGSVLSIVSKNILDDKDPHNEAGLKALAKKVDELEQAVLILHERTK